MAEAGEHSAQYCRTVTVAEYEEEGVRTTNAQLDACVPETALLMLAASCARLSAPRCVY